MTIRELLNTPLMKDAELLAGKGGLDYEVTWCVPDTSLNYDNWIMPGLLLMYTGEHASFSWKKALDAILPRSIPAGMLLFGGKASTFVHEDDFSYFDEKSIPLIRMPKATNPLAFSKRFAAYISNVFEDDHRREEWLEELCCSGDFPGGETVAASYGYCADACYCCVIAKARLPENATLLTREGYNIAARTVLSRELGTQKIPLLCFSDGDILAAFIPWPKAAGADIPSGRIRAAIKRLLSEDPTRVKWFFSVGTAASSLLEFSDSYHNAQRTASVIAALKVHEEVSFYDDWYMHMLLLNEPREKLRVQMERSLSPILKAPELLETLTTYLTFGENLKVVSEKLYIHVNTLKYRLQRISELLRCDRKDPNVRFRLRMAITIERYLRNG